MLTFGSQTSCLCASSSFTVSLALPFLSLYLLSILDLALLFSFRPVLCFLLRPLPFLHCPLLYSSRVSRTYEIQSRSPSLPFSRVHLSSLFHHLLFPITQTSLVYLSLFIASSSPRFSARSSLETRFPTLPFPFDVARFIVIIIHVNFVCHFCCKNTSRKLLITYQESRDHTRKQRSNRGLPRIASTPFMEITQLARPRTNQIRAAFLRAPLVLV